MPTLNITTVAEELVGTMQPTEYYNEHFQEYERDVLAELVRLGYPADLWPSDSTFPRIFIRRVIKTATVSDYVLTSKLIDKASPYTGKKQHEKVMYSFNQQFPLHQYAIFVFTEGEAWWPHEHAWLADDANTFMKYCLYRRAVRDRSILTSVKTRGRPRKEIDPAELQAKAERSERYNQWLADCKVYKDRLFELKANYAKALEELTDHKARGAPIWIP